MATVTKPMALDETLQATNEILDDIKDALANSSIVGDTDISAIADGTLTGAVAEFDGDIAGINTTLEGLGDAATKDVANTYDAESTDPISGQGVADAVEVESLSDTTPYLYRPSPAIGTRVMENALVGASVVVNQLVQNGDFSTTTGWGVDNGTFTISDNIATVTVTGLYASQGLYRTGITVIQNHKYLLIADFKFNHANVDIVLRVGNVTGLDKRTVQNANQWTRISKIVNASENATSSYELDVKASTGFTENETYQVKNAQIIDLTEWFGSNSIPEYAVTLETAQAGSGIAWLKSQGFDFSEYIAYNTGTLESVNPSAKKVVGFNLWDEEWELGGLDSSGAEVASTTAIRAKNYIPCMPNTAYCFTKTAGKQFYAYLYDENKTYIGQYISFRGDAYYALTLPANARFIRFNLHSEYGTTYNHDICINISKTTGTPKNGDYLPYEAHTYPISEYPLRGLFVLDGDSIKASGDRRKSDGKTTRKYDECDLGDLNWIALDNGRVVTSDLASVIKSVNAGVLANIISAKYTTHTTSDIATDTSLIGIGLNGTNVIARTPNNETPSGKMCYELATPTTETIPPFDNPQISIVGGTEEWITDNDVPVGHESEYKALPVLFEDDYIEYLQEKAESAKNKLSDLDDADVSSPTNGQLLTYDATLNKWKNATFATAMNAIVAQDYVDWSNNTGDTMYFYKFANGMKLITMASTYVDASAVMKIGDTYLPDDYLPTTITGQYIFFGIDNNGNPRGMALAVSPARAINVSAGQTLGFFIYALYI